MNCDRWSVSSLGGPNVPTAVKHDNSHVLAEFDMLLRDPCRVVHGYWAVKPNTIELFIQDDPSPFSLSIS